MYIISFLLPTIGAIFLIKLCVMAHHAEIRAKIKALRKKQGLGEHEFKSDVFFRNK